MSKTQGIPEISVAWCRFVVSPLLLLLYGSDAASTDRRPAAAENFLIALGTAVKPRFWPSLAVVTSAGRLPRRISTKVKIRLRGTSVVRSDRRSAKKRERSSPHKHGDDMKTLFTTGSYEETDARKDGNV
ncbi:unnamed protein product [Vicia faba]|uniref:Secreted protein n=1 Tax=Vicia faba TaxID=3906 RepID=A0AAV1A3U5_VICFA|nr:unnamed protein product [Vicia faba]